MKISSTESGKATAALGHAQEKILPRERPRRVVSARARSAEALSPLERGMAVAEAALAKTPDPRAEIVSELKARIERGEYRVTGDEIAEMMLRRLSADRIR